MADHGNLLIEVKEVDGMSPSANGVAGFEGDALLDEHDGEDRVELLDGELAEEKRTPYQRKSSDCGGDRLT